MPTHNVRVYMSWNASLLTSQKITKAFRHYGVFANTSDLLLVRVGAPQLVSSDVEEKMHEVVKGYLVSLSNLSSVTDWLTVKNVLLIFSTDF